MRRILIFAASVVVLATVGVAVVARTEWGHERVRRALVQTVGGVAHGRFTVARVEGDLLNRFTLRDVSITDSAGRPFVSVRTLRARLSLPALFQKRIRITEVMMESPVLTLTKDADGRWNYERIFPHDTTSADTTTGWGDWVSLGHVSLAEGRVQIQRPWNPDDPRARADSALAQTLADSSSLVIVRTPQGLSQVVTLEQVAGVVSAATIATPGERDMHFVVDSLRAVTRMLRAGPFDIRRAAGTVRVSPDSVVVTSLRLALPRTSGHGEVLIDSKSGDIEANLQVPFLAFADVRPLYPLLPDSGTGRLNLQLKVRDAAPSEYKVSEAELRSLQAVVSGSLGVLVGDSVVRFEDTHVRFARVPTALIQRLVPAAKTPLVARLDGEANVEGSTDAMQLSVSALVRPEQDPAFRVSAAGGLGVSQSLTFRKLHLNAERVPVSLARVFDVRPRVGGVVSMDGIANGSSGGRIAGQFHVEHIERGVRSRATVRGTVAPGDSTRMDVTARLHTVSLALLNDFVDSLDAQGDVTGRVHVRGTPRAADVSARLRLPGEGSVHAEGAFQVMRGELAGYRGEMTVAHLAPQAILPSLPLMLVDGTTRFDGQGVDPATMTASLHSRLSLFMIDSAEVRDVVVEARAADGVLQVDSLSAKTGFGSMTAAGTLGLADGHDGKLAYHARVDDLGGLRRWIAGTDTTMVPARPGISARMTRRRARADSLQLAERERRDPAAALAASIQGDSLPRRRARTVALAAIAHDSTAGSVAVDGEVRGHIKRATISAVAKTPGLVWGGNLLGAGQVHVLWSGALTPNDTLQVDGGVDSVRIAGFALDSTRVRLNYRRGIGEADVTMFPGDTAVYRLASSFAVYPDSGQVRLRDLQLNLDSTAWRSTKPSMVSWRAHEIRIDSLELRDVKANARLFANGSISQAGPGRLDIAAERVRIAPWLTILQSDVNADGMLTSSLTVTGTRSSPEIAGAAEISDARYGGTSFPRVAAKASYAAGALQLDATAHNDQGAELARASGTLPMNLALDSTTAPRLPENGQFSLRITGDSIPLAPLVEVTDVVSEVEGTAHGDVTVRGSWNRPMASGGIGLSLAQLRLTSTGVLMEKVNGQLRFAGDSLLIDSLRATSDGPVTASGSVILSPLLNPTVHLTVRADEARVLDDERGELFATGTMRIEGPLDSLGVTGNATVVRGVVFVPDPEKFKVISTQDAALFSLTDTATVQALGLGADSEILRNMRIDMVVEVRRGTFARSADANVEVYGDLRVRTEPPKDVYVVTGALHSDRGSYTLYGKRFDVSGGTVRFVGDDELNPSLQLLATYQVQQAGRAPLDIRVVIGGTLDRPTISLESDAQPTLSQSDLISFLAFGRSSSSLLQFSGTGLEGGGAGGSSLAGNVAALARRQLASLAIGAMVDEVRSELASATRADVLNITPAQLPADVSLGGLETVLRGTEIEFGRYLNERTFVLGRVRPSLTIPGAFVEHRWTPHVVTRASVETRLQATTPSLSKGVTPRSLQIIGALVTWSFAW
ncbi:MAG: translocation/assembly module TamB domain-containing protein [Gemmatimonadaceae bacterium]